MQSAADGRTRGNIILALGLMITFSPTTRAEQPLEHPQARGAVATASSNLAAEDLSHHASAADAVSNRGKPDQPIQKLIVVGFLGGSVSATNCVHREAQLIKSLQESHPQAVHAVAFANRNGGLALKTILHLLGGNNGLTEAQKSAARIVIYGHSWGASETIALADRLNKLGIPVLLTIQVDSVRKREQNDERIPPNVREAVNFYQSEGLLHGRRLIVAMDPERTRILGNHESSYRRNPVSCTGFPWYARAFMRPHIQIENDPAIWNQIEAMILAKIM